MEELELEHKRERFMTYLKVYSENKFNPVPEWILIQKATKQDYETAINYIPWIDKNFDDPQTCICTTPIMNRCLIQNSKTGVKIIIGSVCQNRWLDLKARCQKCNVVLKNFLRRQKEQDWFCRKCHAKHKLMPYVYGKGFWYNKKFSEAVENEELVLFMLNLAHPTDAQKEFIDYALTLWDPVEG